MPKAYHYTSQANWKRIQIEGLAPYELRKPALKGVRGIYAWPARQVGVALIGSVMWQIITKDTLDVVLLEIDYEPEDQWHPEWTVTHDGQFEADGQVWHYHTKQPSVILTRLVPPHRIRLVQQYSWGKDIE